MFQARRLIGFVALAQLAGPSATWTAAPARPATAVYTTITGTAWDANNNPIAGARVRLRNVATTRIVASATANASGKFIFENIEAGSYVVELVDDRDKVAGVGPMFNAQPGDTVATFVRLASQAPRAGALFGNTAAAIIASAAGLGITAVTATGHDISPETPRAAGSR